MPPLARFAAVISCLLFLSACETEGEIKEIPNEFSSSNGKITIFRVSHFVGDRVDAVVMVEGNEYGLVPNDSALRIGLPPGKHNIDIGTSMFPLILKGNPLSIPVEVEAGKEYYVELAAQADPAFTGGAFGYWLGSKKAPINQYCNGSWCAAVEGGAEALPKLAKVKHK